MAGLKPGDYVSFRERGRRYIMVVEEVQRGASSDVVVGEVSDKRGSEAARPGGSYNIGDMAYVRRRNLDTDYRQNGGSGLDGTPGFEGMF